MSHPIKPTVPTPRPLVRTPPAPPAAPVDSRTARPAMPRRAEVERNRPSWMDDAEEREAPLSADGQFFAQLLVPAVREQQDDHSGSAGSAFTPIHATDEVPEQLIDDLTMRLSAHGDGPFSATLLMPNLGKVQIRAQKNKSHWDIELGFTRREVLDGLHARHEACENALSQALGHDVHLSLHEDFNA